MKRFYMVTFYCIIINLLLTGIAFSSDFIWQIDANDRHHYIMGSIHVAKDDLYPLPDIYNKVFSQCDTIVVEIDIVHSDKKKMTNFIKQYGMLEKGLQLSTYIEPETLALLQKEKLNSAFMQGMRPWLMSLSIQIMKLKDAGYDEKNGLDRYFLTKAKKRGLRIVELESIEDQMFAFMTASRTQDDWFLRATLLEYDNLIKTVDTMFEAWKKGDPDAFAAIFFEEYDKYPALVPLLNKMIFQRNDQMAEKIEQMMSQKNNTMFIIVGAGHLVGPKGMIEHFKQKGYAVHQL